MAPSAADVPSKFDVIINSQGYVLYDPWTVGSSSNAPEKGVYTYTPTFVDRQNTQGDYGDNQQDFWLTASQNTWSLGEKQRYFHTGVEDADRKYWTGTSVEVNEPGEVTIAKDVRSKTYAAAVRAVAPYSRGDTTNQTDIIYAMSSTNAYQINSSGTITDDGAHGLGIEPALFGVVSDGFSVYISSAASGTIVRKLAAPGGAFSSFSTTAAADSLEFLNNTLYGLEFQSNQKLKSWNTSGTATTIFEWKNVDGTSRTYDATNHAATWGRIRAYGGKLLIMWAQGQSGTSGAELWVYDGGGVSMLGKLPANFNGYDLCVLNGIALVSGVLVSPASSDNQARPAIFYYANGSLGLLWKSDSTASTTAWEKENMPAMTAFNGGLVFNDDTTGKLMYYTPDTGAVSSIASYTVSGDTPLLAGALNFLLHTRNQTGATLYPHNTTASTGTVSSSLFDFDSSLTKLFRGIKIEYDEASDGDGGSVDISYRVGDVDGSYTSLQTGATSGTEYTLSSVSGRSISVKITLNKGTSTNGPKLKRVYVRAVPVQQNFERFKLVLNCTGRAETGKANPTYIELRDGTVHNLDGLQMATNLRTAAESGSAISFINKFGTVTGVIENLQLTEIRPNEFVAEVVAREV